jgi:hypothetical protein
MVGSIPLPFKVSSNILRFLPLRSMATYFPVSKNSSQDDKSNDNKGNLIRLEEQAQMMEA